MKKTFFLIVGIITCGSLITTYWYTHSPSKNTKNNRNISKNNTSILSSTSSPFPTPTITGIIHGIHTYTLDTNASDDPKFITLTLDPVDPDVQMSQTFTVGIQSTYSLVEASLGVETDMHTIQIPLKLISGTTTDGIWQASWNVRETYAYHYRITVTAHSDFTLNTKTISLRPGN
jgi:hypothetical protein